MMSDTFVFALTQRIAWLGLLGACLGSGSDAQPSTSAGGAVGGSGTSAASTGGSTLGTGAAGGNAAASGGGGQVGGSSATGGSGNATGGSAPGSCGTLNPNPFNCKFAWGAPANNF